MAMSEFTSGCLTCSQSPKLFLDVQLADNNSIKKVLRKHFWFTDDELQRTIICLTCWDQVNNFHRFYTTVAELHHSRTTLPIVKAEPEPAEIGHLEVEQGQHSSLEIEDKYNKTVEQIRERSHQCQAIHADGGDDANQSDRPLQKWDVENVELDQDYRMMVSDCKVDGEPNNPDADTEQLISSIIVKEEPAIAEQVEEIASQIPNQSEAADYDNESELEDQDSTESTPVTQKHRTPGNRVTRRRMPDEYIRKHVKYSCDKCGQESLTFSHFMQHALEIHGDQTATVECCGKKFRRKHLLFEHVQALLNPCIFRCEDCKMTFGNREKYGYHMKQFHGGKKFKCNQCRKSYISKYLLRRHTEEHNSNKWNCPLCEKIYICRYSVNSHIKLKHPDAPELVCNVCSQKFLSEKWFLEHKLKHKELQCLLCTQLFLDGKSLRAHVHQLHPGAELPFMCTICRAVVPSKEALEDHRVREHEPTEENVQQAEKNIESDPSDEETEQEEEEDQGLMELVPIKQKNQPAVRQRRSMPDSFIREHVKYICEKCGQDSLTFKLFIDHAVEVHGDKTAAVACCGRKFRKRYLLFEHVQMLNNPNMFHCKDCDKSFSKSEKYRKHMRLHGNLMKWKPKV